MSTTISSKWFQYWEKLHAIFRFHSSRAYRSRVSSVHSVSVSGVDSAILSAATRPVTPSDGTMTKTGGGGRRISPPSWSRRSSANDSGIDKSSGRAVRSARSGSCAVLGIFTVVESDMGGASLAKLVGQ